MNKRTADWIELAIYGAVVWFALHPDQYDTVKDAVRARVDKWRYDLSVWQALRAIRKLPEE